MIIDENPLNCDINSFSLTNRNTLTDDLLKQKRDELNRVPLKFLSGEYVKNRNLYIKKQKWYFMNKLNKLRFKGI